MIRAQIYLPKKQYDDVKLRASAMGRPAADLIREFIGAGLARQVPQKQKSHGLDALIELKITGGPKDLSTRLDDYLYAE